MDGVINIYKPAGITSFDAVRKIMNVCNTRKVGHTGTLDPLASGVLPICIGRATKIVDYIMSETKVYKVELKLGIETDTYDREGKVLYEKNLNVSKEDIISTLKSFIGKLQQEPPMYSALKVNGKKLYELARKGIVVERKKREITIYDLQIDKISLPFVHFTVKCSKGTYIRSLCHDVGEALEVGGTMWNLERTETGIFKNEKSIFLNDINKNNVKDYIIPIEDALENYHKVYFSSKYDKLLLNGVKLKNEFLLEDIEYNKIYRVYLECNKFIGLGIRDDNVFKIIKLLV